MKKFKMFLNQESVKELKTFLTQKAKSALIMVLKSSLSCFLMNFKLF